MIKEKSLWAAVLGQAVKDLKKEEEYNSAMYWFANRNDVGIGSFIWVCDAIACDADKTRDQIFYNNNINSR